MNAVSKDCSEANDSAMDNSFQDAGCFMSNTNFSRDTDDGSPFECRIPTQPGVWVTMLTRGYCEIEIFGRTIQLFPGDCALYVNTLPSYAVCRVPSGEDVDFSGSYFNLDWLGDVCRRHNIEDALELVGQDRFCVKTGGYTCPLLRCVQEFSHPPLSPWLHAVFKESKAIEFLGLVLDIMTSCDDGRERHEKTTLGKKDMGVLERACRILDEKLEEPITVQDLSRLVGVSVKKLNEIFQLSRSCTAGQYIRDLRLQRAIEILQQEKVNVATAAYRVGLTPNYLSWVFRKRFGFAPSELKKSELKKTDEPQARKPGRNSRTVAPLQAAGRASGFGEARAM